MWRPTKRLSDFIQCMRRTWGMVKTTSENKPWKKTSKRRKTWVKSLTCLRVAGWNTITEDRVDKLKEWISPPLWLNSLEKAQDQRSPSTGLWLFGEPVFKSWLFNVTTPQMSIGRKTMHIKGIILSHYTSSTAQSWQPDYDQQNQDMVKLLYMALPLSIYCVLRINLVYLPPRTQTKWATSPSTSSKSSGKK